MSLQSLKDLYIEELKDIYSAENQIVEALPKMAEAAASKELRAAFESHLKVTKKQIERLEGIFGMHSESPKGKKCKGMEGLLKEGDEMIKEKADPKVRDAALISAAQRVEHYEIAAYGTVRTYARILGLTDDQRILQEILDEEGQTDEDLTRLAEFTINPKAQQAGS